MDFPHTIWQPFNTINVCSPESLGGVFHAPRLMGTHAGASRTSIQNLAIYYPFRLWKAATAVKMSYIVGATANGNVDLGIYTAQKNRLVNSGSVAQGTVNTIQEIDITDTLLMPGVYFMAIQLSSATGTVFGTGQPDENIMALVPIYDQAVGSFGLPNPAAWAPSTQGTVIIVLMAVHFDTLV